MEAYFSHSGEPQIICGGIDRFTILMLLLRTASIQVSSLAIESNAVFLQGGVGKTLSVSVFGETPCFV